MNEQIKVGPFTWRRDDHGEDEVWRLVIPPETGLGFWCLKNYGGAPNDDNGFSGWRLVSGGPFVSAGGWTARNEAMQGVIPYLVEMFRADAQEKMEQAQRIERALGEFFKGLS